VLTAVALSCGATAAGAQLPQQSDPNSVGVTASFGINVLIGGVTAATRAWLEGHDPARAFAYGAIGGAVHFGAKLIGPGAALVGPAVGATGTSIVVNAGRGVSPFDELYLPVGPVRLRFTPRAPRKVRVAFHAHNAVVLAGNLARDGLVMDWARTGSSGTFVLRSDNRHIVSGGREVEGLANASVIVMSDFAADPDQTERHEVVHVHQYWFIDEAVGRPIEEYLRRAIPGARRIPRWLELGVVPPALAIIERSLFGRDGPVYRLIESEAEMLSR
jgi:hypothetical protein